jgi:Holliday junction resolvasome RuvABC DNA-binding subunit
MTPEARRAWQTDQVIRGYRDDLDVLRRVQQHNPTEYTPAVVARVKNEHRKGAVRALEALGYEREQAAAMLTWPPPPPPRTTAEFMNRLIRGGRT